MQDTADELTHQYSLFAVGLEIVFCIDWFAEKHFIV